MHCHQMAGCHNPHESSAVARAQQKDGVDDDARKKKKQSGACVDNQWIIALASKQLRQGASLLHPSFGRDRFVECPGRKVKDHLGDGDDSC